MIKPSFDSALYACCRRDLHMCSSENRHKLFTYALHEDFVGNKRKSLSGNSLKGLHCQ